MRSVYSLGTLILASLLIGCGPESDSSSPSQASITQLESRLSAIETRLAANGDATSTSTTSEQGEAIQSIAVQPPAFTLPAGQAGKIELVTLTTASGEKTILTGFDVLELKMSDESIATINNKGELTAIKAGTTILEVSLGENKQSLPIVISDAAPSASPSPTAEPTATPTPTPTPSPTATPASGNIKAVSVSPSDIELEPGGTVVLSKIFVTLDDGEDTIGALNSVELAELSSSDTTIATVSSNGVVTAISEGTTTIKALYKGVEGTATVTVEDDDS